MNERKPDYDDLRAEDCPIAWFFELELARKKHDFARAAECQRQLDRLGVKVSYSRKAVAHARCPKCGHELTA